MTSLTDDNFFESEQRQLGHLWTFLGLTADLRKDNDWFRATLGGRSVFVQKFGDEIVGFENVCPHRFSPLRTADKGNGAIICGFHHWHFDLEGQVVGIPICGEAFGTTPSEMPARLTPLEIAVCGSLIFGRRGKSDGQSLEAFLGAAWPILVAFSTLPPTLHAHARIVEANWRLMMNITLDDYHTVAVHHRKQYQKTADLQYWRFGLHSANTSGKRHTLQSMSEACRSDARRHRPSGYIIFNIFPNLAISLFKAGPYWYAHIQQFVPISAGRSKWRGWFYRTIFPSWNRRASDRLLRAMPEVVRGRIIRHSLERTGNEDHAVCERLQEVAAQSGEHPLLGKHETRIGWLQESYDLTVQSP